MKELLEKNFQVVLLGYTNITRSIIKALNRDYNVFPILYAPRRPEGCNFFLQYTFLKQQMPENEYYTIRSLLEIPETYEESNYILIPISENFNSVVQNHIEQLENIYIVSSLSKIVASLPSLINTAERNI